MLKAIHCACSVSRDLYVGGRNNHIFGICDPYLSIHCITFMGLRWRLREVYRRKFYNGRFLLKMGQIFEVFGVWGSWVWKSYDFYCKRHLLARIRVVWAIMGENRLRGLTSRSIAEKNKPHRNEVSPLIQCCTTVRTVICTRLSSSLFSRAWEGLQFIL